MIDLRETGVLDRGHDAIAVALGSRAAVTRINQHRLTGRRHEERGVATLHVDDIDVQGLAGLRGRNRRGQREGQQAQGRDAHQIAPPRGSYGRTTGLSIRFINGIGEFVNLVNWRLEST